MSVKSVFRQVRDFNCSSLALPLLTLMYFFGELGHFLITTVSKSVSQDVGFGEQSCFSNFNGADANKNCTDLKTKEECIGVILDVDNDTIPVCEWNYNGLGTEYQLLAGPAFMACFTVAGVIWGLLADRFNRIYLLSGATIFYSIVLLITAYATQYWHLVLLRMALAIGAASTCPLAAGIIMDIFPSSRRALAMGLFNWGIYLGYASSFAMKAVITDETLFSHAWRTSFFLSGIPGLVVGLVFLILVSEPRSQENFLKKEELELQAKAQSKAEAVDVKEEEETKAQILLGLVKRPEIFILAIAACIRHSGGYTGGYNSALYFQTYYPGYDAEWWLFGISIIGGALGTVVGGFTSDRLVKQMGISGRALVLAVSQLISFPFTLGFFYFDPPYSFIAILIGYLTSEMWFGVMYAILVELFPESFRSTAVALALFVINNVGGNLPVVVEPLRKATDYRTAIVIMYPGAYLTSSILFFVCWFLLRNRGK